MVLSMWESIHLLLLVSLISTYAQLIPQDEVETLGIISRKLKNTYWNYINQTSCLNTNQSFNRFIGQDVISNITCNCSYSRGTICHVTNIQLKGLNLTGVFPEEFGNLAHLREIDFSRNYVSGTIPKSLSKIPLAIFSLVGNRMSGVIPDEIGHISTLKQFLVEDNQFEGTLPKSLGNLKNLERLVLAGNYFNGSMPETYANLTKLREVRINGNPISGKIPDFIGKWRFLTVLDIQGTSMEGPIPSSFSLLTNMDALRISDLNSTSMTTFPNLRSLVKLKYLVLRNCFITGAIPNYINSLPNLKLLDLSYNQLNGPIPDLQNLSSSLSYLFLANNSLSGPLPNWISNSRQNFDVSYNNFTGPSTASCQDSSVNVIASYSSQDKNPLLWCLKKNLPCPNEAKYDSLFINCGGNGMKFGGQDYEDDTSSGRSSNFFAAELKWAYSSTGFFMYRESASFLAQETSNHNLTGIYQTARLAPTSLKYYGLCLKQGSYHVKLHFAELMFTQGQNYDSFGRRIFDVAIQGRTVLKDFNIAEKAGGFGKERVEEFNAQVDGSTLEIHLYWAGKGTTGVPDRNAYGPLINAITVTPNFNTASRLPTGAIAGIVLGSCAMLAMILVVLRVTGYLGGRNDENEEFRKLDTGYFTLRQIKSATDDFSLRNKIGEGGFGPVFKGVLPDGKVIAVKQLSSKSKQGNREFINEIGMISALQHPNLVKLFGCCIEGKELLLIYEYMENNCLARALFGRDAEKFKLDWQTRKKICLGIARGLAYLHEESRLKIVHRDIKATNVLLDKELNAKISDFGLAKLDEEENTHISTRVAGTIGYMAPEYAMRGYLTDKADVYSFGVVVLEIVSGKSNTNYRPKEDFVYLLDWAYVLHEQGNILELVDPNLGSNYNKEEALRLLNLALLCTNPSPTLRPIMSSVISMIDGHIPIQAPTIKAIGTNEELRFKSLERLSQHSQTHVSSSSQSSQMQRSTSTTISWAESSVSGQSKE